jgi:indolepyruvate ferredoxin oxidoreductase
VAVAGNLRALELGRAVACDAALAAKLLDDATPPAIGDGTKIAAASSALGRSWSELHEALNRFEQAKDCDRVTNRIAALALDLVDYQSPRLAARFCARIARLAEAEASLDPESPALSEAAAIELYRFLAYKDEYEVARLLLRGPHRRWLRRHSAREPRVRYHLHPPLLRSLGLTRKLAFGPWIEPFFAALIRARGLRGTALDPFGWTRARKLERELAGWFEGVLDGLGARLRAENRAEALEIVKLAAGIRGYENVKAARAESLRPIIDRKLAAVARRS